jgi:hypothetical protein
MNNKLFFGLVDRFNKLCRDHEDLYFKERPWLLEPYVMVAHPGMIGLHKEKSPHPLTDCSCERKQVELEMKKVSDKIDKMCNPAKPVEDKVIEDLFGAVPS